LRESFDPELLSDCQERVELLLRHIHLTHVHEVKDGEHFLIFDTLQVEKWMLMWIPPQHVTEERRAGREDHFVGRDLAVFTGQCNIEKVFLLP